jgi:hypothetical protein
MLVWWQIINHCSIFKREMRKFSMNKIELKTNLCLEKIFCNYSKLLFLRCLSGSAMSYPIK